MKNYFNGWWHKKNADSQISSQPKETFPSRDDSIEDWKAFVSTHSWKDVLHARAKFIPRAGYQKDEEILQITWQKLIQIEQPNVCAAFISEHKDCIIWVDFRASNQTVKKVVAQKYSSMSRPCFVLETTGKLRGFALSENLVIAGTAAMSVFPHTAVNQVTSLGLNFLTKEDSVIIEANFDELNNMMLKVNVPRCNSNWMISKEGQVPHDPYDGYDIRHCNRFTYYEHDDFTVIFAKL